MQTTLYSCIIMMSLCTMVCLVQYMVQMETDIHRPKKEE